MIYTKTETHRFDDTIIRSVDALINASYFDQRYWNHKAHIQPQLLHSEFRTLSLSLPRRCGKTTYLAKLAKYFKLRGKSVIVFAPKLEMIRREPWSEMQNLNKMSYEMFKKSDRCYRSISADIILYDEVFDFEHYGDDFTVSLHTRI